jgi:hypothetical protein
MTSLLPPYKIGTATVAHGATTVTIAIGIMTDSNCRELDEFVHTASGVKAFIRSRTDASHFEIEAWPGTSLAGENYSIEKTSLLRGSFGGTDAQVQKLLDILQAKGLIWPVIGASPDADGLVGDQDQLALKSNSGPWQMWRWNLGAWERQSDPFSLTYRGEWNSITAFFINDRVSRFGISYTAKQNNINHDPATDSGFVYWDAGGAKGDPGTNGATWTSGTAVPSGGNDGDFYFRSSTFDIYRKVAGVWGVIANVRGDDGTDGTNGATWTSGTAAPAGGNDGDFYFRTSTFDIYKRTAGVWNIIANPKGTDGASMRGGAGVPSNSLGINGDRYFRSDTSDVYLKAGGAYSVEANVKGQTGATPVISGTSTSVLTVTGSGSLSLTTQPGLALAHGQRIRIANPDVSRVMAGSVDTYNPATGALTLLVDFKTGSGVDNNWTIGLSGELGIGSTGPPGAASSVPGPPGNPGAASIVPGPPGLQGTGIQPDDTGTMLARGIHDSEAKGYKYLVTDTSPFQLFIKASNTSGDWAGPTFIGGQAAIGDMGLITDSVLDVYDYGSIAA